MARRLCARMQIPRRNVNRVCTEPFVAHGHLVAATMWDEDVKSELWLLDDGRLGLVTRTGSSAVASRWDLGIDCDAELEVTSLDEAAAVFRAAADLLSLD